MQRCRRCWSFFGWVVDFLLSRIEDEDANAIVANAFCVNNSDISGSAEQTRFHLCGSWRHDHNPPLGFVVDHTRIKLGDGENVFAAAKAGLERWEFHPGWVEAIPSTTPIQAGQVVAVVARIFGVWLINACRIVYLVDDQGRVRRFGFAYGTLPEHVESGEERFTVEWHEDDGTVWYDILAFSRPRHFLARLGYPYARRLQKRFARDSTVAMLKAVANAG